MMSQNVMSTWPRLLLLPLAFMAGCQPYLPMSLKPEAVNRELAVPPDNVLRVRARDIHHPLLQPLELNYRDGLSPDEAAVLAVLVNPSLRAERDRRALAAAQLLTAGILPNPQLSAALDVPTGGKDAGTVNGYNIGLNWDVTALISRGARQSAAAAQAASVDLDVAWQEWQVAQTARTALFDLVALQAQVTQAELVDHNLAENLEILRRAVDQHEKTVMDLAAAETASQDAHAVLLGLQQDLRHQRLVLNQSLGLPPDASVRPQAGVVLPSRVRLPSEQQLTEAVQDRRLDLLALKRGYESQEETLRAAVLAQFPKINLGFNRASDTSNVHTTGFGVSIDLPIFDRNQGGIATEQATRQKLYDEYLYRLFEARSQIAMSLADIRSLEERIAVAESALPVLETLVSTYRDALEQGNADVLSYYTAVGNLAQRQLDVLKLKQQLVQNRIALEIAAGQYLPDELPSPATHLSTSESLP
jgi:cobalt-zinc-cadmium efflux system outer membrane protein